MRDDQCIGAAEGEYEPDGCPHEPAFVVGGDFACRHHLVRVIRWRIAEVGDHAVQVDIVREES